MNGLNESLRKRHGVVEWKNNELLGKKKEKYQKVNETANGEW